MVNKQHEYLFSGANGKGAYEFSDHVWLRLEVHLEFVHVAVPHVSVCTVHVYEPI